MLKTGKTDAKSVVLARFLEKRCRNGAVLVQFFAVKSIDSGVYRFAIL